MLASAKIDGKDVLVVDKRNKRELVYDHVIHSRLYNNSIYTRQYWDYFIPLPSIFNNPRVLIIGLGGGTMPFQIQKIYGKKARIDVVELKREMIGLSKAFLPEKLEARIILEDGYDYISKKKGAYDIIISDPYVGETIPDDFFGADYIQGCYDALSDDGILAINYALTLKDISKKPGLVKRLGKLFKVYTLNYPYSSGNIILICSKKAEAKEIFRRIDKNLPKDAENQFLIRAYSSMK